MTIRYEPLTRLQLIAKLQLALKVLSDNRSGIVPDTVRAALTVVRLPTSRVFENMVEMTAYQHAANDGVPQFNFLEMLGVFEECWEEYQRLVALVWNRSQGDDDV